MSFSDYNRYSAKQNTRISSALLRHLLVGQSVTRLMDGWLAGGREEGTDGWMEGLTDGWTDGGRD